MKVLCFRADYFFVLDKYAALATTKSLHVLLFLKVTDRTQSQNDRGICWKPFKERR